MTLGMMGFICFTASLLDPFQVYWKQNINQMPLNQLPILNLKFESKPKDKPMPKKSCHGVKIAQCYQIFAQILLLLKQKKMLSSHGSFLTIATYHRRETN